MDYTFADNCVIYQNNRIVGLDCKTLLRSNVVANIKGTNGYFSNVSYNEGVLEDNIFNNKSHDLELHNVYAYGIAKLFKTDNPCYFG